MGARKAAMMLPSRQPYLGAAFHNPAPLTECPTQHDIPQGHNHDLDMHIIEVATSRPLTAQPARPMISHFSSVKCWRGKLDADLYT